MKKARIIYFGIGVISLTLCPHASTRTSANYSITTETIDSAGVNAQSANYALHGSAVGEFGVASAASDTSADYIVKNGYVGQLYEVITPTTVVSRKIHGTGAPSDPRFNIPLPLNLPVNGTPGIEC